MGDHSSQWLTLHGAMPQGSGLGTLCFVVYVSRMELLRDIWTHKYIDDTTLSEAIATSQDSKLQEAANLVQSWSVDNMMRINPIKTKEMLIHFRLKPLDLTPIVLDNKEVEQVEVMKLLGLLLTNDLK